MPRRKQQDPELITDPKELAERQEAAAAYGEEDPNLYVDYCHACIDESQRRPPARYAISGMSATRHTGPR